MRVNAALKLKGARVGRPGLLILLVVQMVVWQATAHPDDLAKASQNPIGDIVSLPVEVWHYDGMPEGTDANVFLLKPVYPVSVGSLDLVNRAIVPYVDLNGPDRDADFGPVEIPEDAGREGWGNIQYQAFFRKVLSNGASRRR